MCLRIIMAKISKAGFHMDKRKKCLFDFFIKLFNVYPCTKQNKWYEPAQFILMLLRQSWLSALFDIFSIHTSFEFWVKHLKPKASVVTKINYKFLKKCVSQNSNCIFIVQHNMNFHFCQEIKNEIEKSLC